MGNAARQELSRLFWPFCRPEGVQFLYKGEKAAGRRVFADVPLSIWRRICYNTQYEHRYFLPDKTVTREESKYVDCHTGVRGKTPRL